MVKEGDWLGFVYVADCAGWDCRLEIIRYACVGGGKVFLVVLFAFLNERSLDPVPRVKIMARVCVHEFREIKWGTGLHDLQQKHSVLGGM